MAMDLSNSSYSSNSSLRQSLFNRARKPPVTRPSLYGTPRDPDLIAMLTQSKLEHRTVMLPCQFENGLKLLVCVDHIRANDSFEWSVYHVNGDAMNLVWRDINPHLHQVGNSINNNVVYLAGRVTPVQPSEAPELFGQFLLNSQIISHACLVSALQLQKSARCVSYRVGEILVLSGAVNARVMEIAVELFEMSKQNSINSVTAAALLQTAHSCELEAVRIAKHLKEQRRVS